MSPRACARDSGQAGRAQLPLEERERGLGDLVPPRARQLAPSGQQEQQRGRRGRRRQRKAHLLALAARLVLLETQQDLGSSSRKPNKAEWSWRLPELAAHPGTDSHQETNELRYPMPHTPEAD